MYDIWLKNREDAIKKIDELSHGDPNLLRNYKEGLIKDCHILRESEYPHIVEFIDAYYHERNGDSSKMNEYLSKVTAVKVKYPLPTY